MNIKDLPNEKVEEIQEEKEVIENLDNAVIKIKAENKLEELENKSKELINLLEDFSKKVPPMINRLDIINDGLKLEELQNTLTSIKNNSDSILQTGNGIIEYNRKIIQQNQVSYQNQIKEFGEIARKNMSKREYFYYLLDKILLITFITMIILNLGTVYYYNKQLNKTNLEVSNVHNLLAGEAKYWIDEENYKVFIKHFESKK